MARYSAGVKTGAGSTTLPIISLYGIANIGAAIREIGVTNTTATAVDIKVVRLTTTGTQGAALTAAKFSPTAAAASCTAKGTHTVAPTLGDDCGYRASLGAAIGSGVIWTFGANGLEVRNPTAGTTTADGIGVIVENGTGQACQAYITWDE
jgi:hypothetical protein